MIPGSFHVVASGKQTQPYSFVVERVEPGDRVAVSDLFIPVEWSLRWYSWPANPRQLDRHPLPETWAKTIGAPLLTETRSTLTVPPNARVSPPGVPKTHFGAVATATVDVPEGSYLIEIVGGGYRVAVDGRWVLAQVWPDYLHRRSVVLDFPRGRHDLRVEIYHAIGPAVLDFQIRKAIPAEVRAAAASPVGDRAAGPK